MPHRARVRCPSCRHFVPVNVVWAIHDVCPRCGEPLVVTGGSTKPWTSVPADPSDGRSAAVVTEWVEAFNDHDLDGMLARMHPRVDFQPLRFPSLETAYRGHEGVRSWFGQLQDLECRYRMELSEVRGTRGDGILALGQVLIADQPETVPFWALQRIGGGLIVASYQYLTDREIYEHSMMG